MAAAIRVHSLLKPGFLEAVYAAALAVEFRRRGIDFEREAPMPVDYDGERLPVGYRVDFLVGGVIVELKAQRAVGAIEAAQVLNYLRAAGGGVGLLLNFGEPVRGIRHFRV